MSEIDQSQLPYNMEKPAEMWDVLEELTNLIILIAGVANVSSHRTFEALIKDATKEPGRSVIALQARLGIALETWRGQGEIELVKSLDEALPNILSESFVRLHAKAHS